MRAATADRLGTPLLSIDEILQAFRTERATGTLAPSPPGAPVQ